MIDRPLDLADSSPRMRALAALAVRVTTEPWACSRTLHAELCDAGLSDEDILHALELSAYFGHLNRIADAVAVPLDYTVKRLPPHADPTVAALRAAPKQLVGDPAIDMALRPATLAALKAWHDHVFDGGDARRTRIASWVARSLGDGAVPDVDVGVGVGVGEGVVDTALQALTETVTLAPWQLGDHSFAALRAAGWSDAQVFGACVAATTAGVVSRIRVALAALAA